ncbi:unnamed protein product [Closterium sp. Naga37s-1]|nr:unnamed protein product [Closterium sp. Naga37s-1]
MVFMLRSAAPVILVFSVSSLPAPIISRQCLPFLPSLPFGFPSLPSPLHLLLPSYYNQNPRFSPPSPPSPLPCCVLPPPLPSSRPSTPPARSSPLAPCSTLLLTPAASHGTALAAHPCLWFLPPAASVSSLPCSFESTQNEPQPFATPPFALSIPLPHVTVPPYIRSLSRLKKLCRPSRPLNSPAPVHRAS